MKMLKKGLTLIGLLMAVLLLASCMPEAATEAPGSLEGTGKSNVTMQGLAFQPAELTISAGATVTWTNEDNVGHTVSAGKRGTPTGEFDQNVPAGETFNYTFEEPGTYDYYCSIHPGMDGIVIVE